MRRFTGPKTTHALGCRPFVVNELEPQHLLHDRRKVYEVHGLNQSPSFLGFNLNSLQFSRMMKLCSFGFEYLANVLSRFDCS